MIDDGGSLIEEPMSNERRFILWCIAIVGLVAVAIATLLTVGVILGHRQDTRDYENFYRECTSNGGSIINEQCVNLSPS